MTDLWYEIARDFPKPRDGELQRFTLATKPTATAFGTGQCIVDHVEYTSDGVTWRPDSVVTGYTWVNKPAASSFGQGQAWFSDIGAMGYSDGVLWTDIPRQEELDRLYVANESRLVKIRQRLYSASQGGTLNYVLTGDSTRSSNNSLTGISKIQEYYKYQLAKIGVTISDNADSSDAATGWLANTGDVTLNQALALISGTGSNSILEFSFGINDWSLTPTHDYIKTQIKGSIDALLAARADLAILLVSPVKTASANRNIVLENVYKEVANEYQLPFISGYDAMYKVYDSTPGPYNTDETHPNEWGSKRVVNYILDKILPASCLQTVTLEEMLIGTGNLAGAIKTGKYWSTTTGIEGVSANWRSLPEIPVYGATQLKVNHKGNKTDVICMDSSATFIMKAQIPSTYSVDRLVYLPYNTAEVRINISDQGATYDALNDAVSVTQDYQSLAFINKGLCLNNYIWQ